MITLTNREFAIAIWMLILLILALCSKSIRHSLSDVLKALFVRKLLIPLLILLFYVFLNVLFLKYIHFWDLSALKDTVFWTFGVAVTSYFNIEKAITNETYFRDFIIDNVKLIAIIEFVQNLYSFSLPVELIVIPVLTFIIMVRVIADKKPEYKTVKKLFDFILGLFGIFLIVFTIKEVVFGFSDFATIINLRDFLLPLVLSILFIPFIYLMALYVQYENLFVRIDIVNVKSKFVNRAKRKIFFSCFLNLNKLDKFAKNSKNLRIINDIDINALLISITK